jgi:hypothetical protein
MRVKLPGIIRRVLHKDGRAAETLRRQQSQRAKPQGAPPPSFAVYARAEDNGDCRCYGCTGRQARLRLHR